MFRIEILGTTHARWSQAAFHVLSVSVWTFLFRQPPDYSLKVGYSRKLSAIYIILKISHIVLSSHLNRKVSLLALEEVVVGTEGVTKSIQLGCEMMGFLRPDKDLQWYNGSQLLPLEGANHSVIVKEGTPGAGQSGQNGTVHSRLSVLNINNPTVADSGVYSCKVRGTNTEATMSLTISKTSVEGKI